jgi:uncharacterized protein YwgA
VLKGFRHRRRDMTKEEILSKVLNVLGYDNPPDMSSFDTRLKFQKLIYLLQFSGISLGYGYSWYVRGPYSPELTQSLFKIEKDKATFEKSKSITFKDNEIIVSKLDEFNRKLGENKDNVNYLEVLASMHYINKVSSSKNKDKENLKIRLLEAKPSLKAFSDINSLINKAYEDLNKFN